jgi:hypothetical protein
MNNFNNFNNHNQAPETNYPYPEKGLWGVIYGDCGSGDDNLDDAIRQIANYSPLPHNKIKEICLKNGRYSYGYDDGYCAVIFEGHLEIKEGDLDHE